MTNITYQEYWKEVSELADAIVSEAMTDPVNGNDRDAAEDDINDSRLHETIDGHQWIIYYAYNLDVIQHSDNADYYADNFGGDELEHCLRKNGLDGLHTAIAFFALYADVQDKISDALENYEVAA